MGGQPLRADRVHCDLRYPCNRHFAPVDRFSRAGRKSKHRRHGIPPGCHGSPSSRYCGSDVGKGGKHEYDPEQNRGGPIAFGHRARWPSLQSGKCPAGQRPRSTT
ncbi:MAG: hypothetical protein MZV64_59935 [Ignavibacteriales bacterium]|nr:hypothetical protein [Ignavibacteriales bacterium]